MAAMVKPTKMNAKLGRSPARRRKVFLLSLVVVVSLGHGHLIANRTVHSE